MGTVVESSTSYTISTVPGGEPLGMENGSIPDESITASSSAGPAPPHLGRLNGAASWCTAKSEGCYLQVDLGSLHLLCAVATQGNPGGNRDYVKRYKLQCSSDGNNWTVYEENGNNIIEGNTDNDSVKRKDLEQEFITRYVRFCPVDWYCWPCMRVELYGAALNIGEKIAHLESEEGGGFVIDKVMVTTYEAQTDENEEPGQEITVDKGQDYLVHIFTGTKWGAGTDANVLITIFGEEGDSGERKLDNDKNNFENGQKDSFTLSCSASLGRLTKIRIGHDNTGFGAAWFLDKVIVEDPKTGNEVEFPCERWFSTSEDDGQITRELTRADGKDEEMIVDKGKVMVTTYEVQADESEEPGQETTVDIGQDYLVHIFTGTKWGAGTDANVLITIFGEEGDSGERKLDNDKNNFENGQKDSFTVSCAASLGRLTKIRIGHDNTGFGAAWFLDKVIVEDPKTGNEVEFPCERWFSTSEDDGQITRELTRADGKDEEMIVDKGHDYLVHIFTGTEWGAGTDANVLITVFGEGGDSGERRLDNDKNNFENGQKDSFTLSCATSLGRLNKIRIGHDNTGFGAAWFLDKVIVEDPKTGESVEFPCEQWFSTSEGDGQITRELTRADEKDEEMIVDKGHDYLVHIYTGDKWGAGTDANVLITIFGEEGDSGERILDNNKNNFENGQKDSFTLSCATSLGRLNKIRIGHDNTGFGAAWFLDKVAVEDPKTGEIVEFPCQRWFATSEDDGQITRELTRADVKDDEMIVVVQEERTQSQEGGGLDNVLVPADETHVEINGEPDQDDNSLKEQEKRIIREAKERQRKEEEQKHRLEEIEIIIEQEEGKREDMDKERREAEARMKLVLDEERMMQRREKPDGEDDTQHQEKPQQIEERHIPEYSRIEDDHRRRMEEISVILEEDEKRRNREKEEKRMKEEDARKTKEEERRKRDEELKQKREEERRKWEEEHRKWEEERKKRDRELEAVLEEGRKKRAEDRRRREEELKKNREEERRKREEERKKRMEEETKKLEELRREREERWNRKANVVIADVDLSVQGKEGDDKNRQEEKKRKEEGWKKAVETPRKIEEDLKKFRDEERKRLEEERKKLQESEHAEAEAEKEFKSELRVRRRGEPDTTTHVTVAAIQLGPSRDVAIAEEKRRIEWRMEKIEQDRLVREEEEKKRNEEAERKKKEREERMREEEERKRKEQEEERERRAEELRLKREAEERERQEDADRRREEEETRRKTSLEEKRKRLEEERKKREEEEQIWRREMEERKRKEEEERQKQIESKKNKRLSIERKRFEEEEKKRLDAIDRKRMEEEERVRMEEEQRRREERERWKMKQMEKRRSGEIYRRKSEEDLRNREDRASFKERQRQKRDSKHFETKWMFINGERIEAPDDDDSIKPEVIDISRSEPAIDIFKPSPRPEKPADQDEKDSHPPVITRISYQGSRDRLPRSESEHRSLNGDVMPYRSQPHCDHLLPTDPAVQMAEEMSFFDKYEENEGKLRPFPSWYGGLDMGSLPHLYSPANPITDTDIDQLLAIESEDFTDWKRVKKSRELEIYSRKGTERGSPPVTKAVMVLKDVPYRDAIDLVSDWDERTKWDKTFDGVSFLDQMADFKVLKCSYKKKNRCLVLASLDREDEEPYYAWTWKSATHPSVPGEDNKVTVLRLDTGICGAIIRPYHDATRSSKITIITQVRGTVPSSLKSTYLTGNPSKWLIWFKKHYDSRLKNTAENDEDDDKKKDDSSSVSSKSEKQD